MGNFNGDSRADIAAFEPVSGGYRAWVGRGQTGWDTDLGYVDYFAASQLWHSGFSGGNVFYGVSAGW
ncbi:hypothetical protein I6A84_39820 [Frankia sp. CNm7]|uniref:Uncharacterized protein n=1 Tax=Frankia nepalensis TaxID=1836974 RepID=A0A937RTT4_9ACTN|nr:hypothetical protein [Frankia nepalensis]MBL7495938.1 hypothetical protein [Frankia nepalensis]MBL7513589.1 hypothetical protein [Frankia nepalensis]MBL7524029.1 hypothetical protein [Frankia nepalensis]MBL7632663.1 hypothetical protein [Frankia nepalensis]